eukprot:6820284-Pyramimonas_sp.AAC.1
MQSRRKSTQRRRSLIDRQALPHALEHQRRNSEDTQALMLCSRRRRRYPAPLLAPVVCHRAARHARRLNASPRKPQEGLKGPRLPPPAPPPPPPPPRPRPRPPSPPSPAPLFLLAPKFPPWGSAAARGAHSPVAWLDLGPMAAGAFP